MGVCCSKESTGVVSPVPFFPDAKSGNDLSAVDNSTAKEREHGDSLSAPSFILGRHERTLKARQFLLYNAYTMQKPTATAGQPWTDERFPHVFEKDREGKIIKLTWKRPQDFTSSVRLFGDSINRYCVKQGQVSDCFFISTLSAIADHPEYIKQIFSDDAYETQPSKYTGILHCRFCWMGEWIDVYTDDILPCSDDWDRYVGVHCDDKSVVWIPMAEKALARLYGSYPQISGNQRDVFRLLTGGLVEDCTTIRNKNGGEYLPPDKLFERVDKALKSGSTVLTSTSEKIAESEFKGLVPYHAYAVTGTLSTQHKNLVTKLLRLRNPWGQKEKTGKINDGEWKGRWSFTSTKWKEVDEVLRKKHNVHVDKGGESWICMEDFFKLFEYMYIGDRIPNFDRDGFRKEDGLDKVINILGEWHGVTSAGNEEKNKMRNPRFILTIPGNNNEKSMSVVIEITRQFENPANSNDDTDKIVSAIDLYKIEKEEVRYNRTWMSLNKQAFEKSYIGSRTATYLCRLSPGDHLLLPYYYDKHVKKPVSKSFCIRIFTHVMVKCSQLNEYPIAFYGDWNHPFGEKDDAAFVLNLFGEWKGETAAGYTKNKMRNPKFTLSVPDINSTGQQPTTLLLNMRCSLDVGKSPNSDIDVFKIEKDQPRKKGLWRSMKLMPKMEKSRFTSNYLFKYELMSGNYLLMPFFYDEESIECKFCIRIMASTQVQCRPQTENPVLFVREAENSLPYGNQSYKLDKVDIVFGDWVRKLTAGGQISHSSFERNPQYGLSIEGNGNQPVFISLLQEKVDPIYAIGCHIIQIDDDHHLPVSKDILHSNAKMKTVTGKTHPLMFSSETSGHYMLPPGRYLILVYADKPTDEKRFALVIAAQAQSKIRITEPK